MENKVIVDGIELMELLFVNRHDTYALQNADGAYRRINGLLTSEILHRHLLGQITIGTYILNKKDEVKYFVIDIDEDDTCCLSISNMIIQDHPAVKLISNRFDHFEIPIAIEFSGRRGFHLWSFLKAQTPAHIIRTIALGIINEVQPDLPESISIEIFPKQDILSSSESWGNPIKIPFGIHQVTGSRSCFLDANLRPFGDGNEKMLPAQLEYLKDIPKLSSDHIRELADQFSCGEEIDVTNDKKIFSDFGLTYISDPVKAIYNNCEKMRELRTKAMKEKKLTYTERRNFASVFARVPGGEKEIHEVMKHCTEYKGKGGYSYKITQTHIDNIENRLRPVTCAQLCGCNSIRNRGRGGSPIAFAYNQNQTAYLKLNQNDSNTEKEV